MEQFIYILVSILIRHKFQSYLNKLMNIQITGFKKIHVSSVLSVA